MYLLPNRHPSCIVFPGHEYVDRGLLEASDSRAPVSGFKTQLIRLDRRFNVSEGCPSGFISSCRIDPSIVSMKIMTSCSGELYHRWKGDSNSCGSCDEGMVACRKLFFSRTEHQSDMAEIGLTDEIFQFSMCFTSRSSEL